MSATLCPGCGVAMSQERLEGHFGRPLTIDLCLSCQTFWFDAGESLHLSPASTLRLFRLIGDRTAAPQPATRSSPACPRCGARMNRTHDMQRTTRFEYLACPNRHGQLTTFFNFLREKNFIRPLSAQQIADLRANVQSVHCSNCGAAIDLATETACAHCGAPLSMLDMEQAGRLVSELKQADRRDQPVDPTLPMQLQRARRDVQLAFDAFERDAGWFSDVSSSGLVGAGLTAVARWLKREVG